ncbi:hypothetical protein [Paraflavitalea speifideaquila]|uniref:hypothetical protein n=1 Tax=Paraflavitalea speifideaquila TaxID=3076558 RepID=UPI0028EED3A7|nr:hypothetical protein [Paraflavitalea speifideiaquila]
MADLYVEPITGGKYLAIAPAVPTWPAMASPSTILTKPSNRPSAALPLAIP